MKSEKNTLLETIFCSDWEFYERHIAHLQLKDQVAFMKEFPDFLKCDGELNEDIEHDEIYQKVKERIENTMLVEG